MCLGGVVAKKVIALADIVRNVVMLKRTGE